MLSAWIIENDKKDYQNLKQNLLQYAFLRNLDIKTKWIKDPTQLLTISKSQSTQIYFIDIQLDHANGIDIAKSLRAKQANARIIFVSAFPDYVFETFVVHPEYFLRKPIAYKELQMVLDRLLSDSKKRNTKEIIIRSIDDGSRILLKISNIKAIMLVNSDKRLLKFITTDGEYYAHGRLEKYDFLLDNKSFYQSYRNTIVNLNYVKKIFETSLLLDDQQELPLAKARRKEMLREFILTDKE